jgi:predicted methyltransferase
MRRTILSILMAVPVALGQANPADPPAPSNLPAGAAKESGSPSVSASAQTIDAAVANPNRPSTDLAQDPWRKPKEVLGFLEARPGMHVIDFLAADGYYSELLSYIVGPTGKVIVYNNGGYARFAGQKLEDRFQGSRLPNTEQLQAETGELSLAPASLDAALFVMSYHDLYYTPKGATQQMGDPKQVLSVLMRALKPGGLVVVEDHVAGSAGNPAEVVNALHRIDPELVKKQFKDAGFKYAGENRSLRHREDDHSKLVFDESIRHRTDQFLYRFRKPVE